MKYLIITILLTLTGCNIIHGWAINKCVEKCGVGKVESIYQMFEETATCNCTNGWQLKITANEK